MLLTLVLLLQTAGGPSPVSGGGPRQLDVRLPRLEAAVIIDGVLGEPVWRQAARLTGFTQYRPVDSRPAADSTVALVWYAPDAIYFGIRAYEAHGSVVRATLADRDNIDADDKVQILLDTYDDHRRALLFAVNPLGVQQDGVRSEGQDAGAAGGGVGTGRFDGIVDLSPDFVYQSRGRVTAWGYEVEVRIPFKSIRYQSADPQNWGLQIVRTTQHTGYEDTWAPTVRASASFLIQSGRLQGLTGLHRGLVMDLNPEFTTHVDGAPRAGGAGPGYVYKGDPQPGAIAHRRPPGLQSVAPAARPWRQLDGRPGVHRSPRRLRLQPRPGRGRKDHLEAHLVLERAAGRLLGREGRRPPRGPVVGRDAVRPHRTLLRQSRRDRRQHPRLRGQERLRE